MVSEAFINKQVERSVKNQFEVVDHAAQQVVKATHDLAKLVANYAQTIGKTKQNGDPTVLGIADAVAPTTQLSATKSSSTVAPTTQLSSTKSARTPQQDFQAANQAKQTLSTLDQRLGSLVHQHAPQHAAIRENQASASQEHAVPTAKI